jgi:outer membrane receptor protein involved in Fe transport
VPQRFLIKFPKKINRENSRITGIEIELTGKFRRDISKRPFQFGRRAEGSTTTSFDDLTPTSLGWKPRFQPRRRAGFLSWRLYG